MAEIKTAWLNVSKISDTVWRIEDAGMVSEYLVLGSDRALLVDCGWGIGDLAKTVSELTSLPLVVVNTHGHPDHTDGNFRFDDAHVHEGDVHLLKNNYNPAVRAGTLKRFPKHTWPDGFDEHAWVNAPLKHFIAFKGPQTFDLGGRKVDVIETPGHTHGSVCLYDHKERLLFAGDNIQSGNVLLMMPDSTPLATYAKSVDRLVAMADRIDRIYPSHNQAPVKPTVLMAMQAGLRKVLDGEIKGKPESTYLGKGLALQFEGCGLLYNEEKLR